MDATRAAFAESFCRQIIATTAPFRTRAGHELTVLDVGCGYGHTSLALARQVRRVVGIEPSPALHARATVLLRESGAENVQFRLQDAASLNEVDAYDLVVMDNVVEHIADQAVALNAVYRAMAPAGVLFILAPNRLWPIEAHYGLPFLSYLPLSLANRYLQWSGRGTDYSDASHAPTYASLSRLCSRLPGFRYQFVLPADLSLATLGTTWHYRLGAALIRHFPGLWKVSKSLLVVGVKTQS